MIKIEVIDALGNGWDFEGENIRIVTEANSTIIIDKSGVPGMNIIGSFVNIAGSKLEHLND